MDFEEASQKFEGVNEKLEDILQISPDIITVIVICICAILFVFSVFSRKIRSIAPASMVSAGIIGTFWGTFLALSEFEGIASNGNPDEIIENVRPLLKGMQTAFITSLIGLFSAFISKIALNFFPQPGPEPLPIENETKQLLEDIKNGIAGEGDKSLSSQMGILRTEYRDGVNALKQSISGDGESSITAQLIKLRNESADGFKTLDGKLDGLADAIRESLVKSLESLMSDLREAIINQLAPQLEKTNELLREQLGEMLNRIEEALIKQFGETFKQFNEATQAIKKWQEDHRVQVEQLTEAFRTTTEGIEKIRVDCEKIPETMQQLRTLMGELDERLAAFANMKEKAESSFPVIKEHLDTIGEDMKKSAEGFSGLERVITDSYTKAGELAQSHIERAQRHIESVGEQITNTGAQIRAAAEEAQNACRQSVQDSQKAFSELVEQTRNQIKEMSGRITEASENMIAETRNASVQQQDDIRKIIETIQSESQKCVQDTSEKLSKMANDQVEATGAAMDIIARKWGENMVAIADRMARGEYKD